MEEAKVPETLNILCLIEDPIVKKKTQMLLNQYFSTDSTIVNIQYVSKFKRSSFTLNNNNDISNLDEASKIIKIESKEFSDFYDVMDKHFGGKELIVLVVDEPKVFTLLSVLAYSDNFPVSYFIELDKLSDINLSFDKTITSLSKENLKDYPKDHPLFKYFQINKNNHASPLALGSEMWPIAARVLINLILMEKPTTVSSAYLKLLKEKHNVRVDLSKAMMLFSSPRNPKLNFLTTKSPHYFEHCEFEVDYTLLYQIVYQDIIPKSALCPLIPKKPFLAYNAYVTFNHKLFTSFLTNPDSSHDIKIVDHEQVIDRYSEYEENVDISNDTMIVNHILKSQNPVQFLLDKNYPAWSYLLENVPYLKISDLEHKGEYLIDGKTISLQKTYEDLKNSSLALSEEKISTTEILHRFRDYITDVKKHLTSTHRTDSNTEFDLFYKNNYYNHSKITKDQFWDVLSN